MPSQGRLTPSDIRRREKRKIERTVLAEQGLLSQKPKTFRLFVHRLNPRRAIAESANSQQDLNRDLSCSAFDLGAMEHTRGRLSIMADGMEAAARELAAKGWTRV